MRLIRLILINMKRQLKNPLMIMFTFMMPVFMVIVMRGNFFGGSSTSDIGIIDNSSSKISKELVNKLDDEYDIVKVKGKIEDNYNLIRDSKVGAIYVIDKDFANEIEQGKAPNIKCYKKEEVNGLMMSDNIISDFITDRLENDISAGVTKNSIKAVIEEKPSLDKSDFSFTVLFTCYCMMIGGSIITADLLKLKEQKVLRRTIATSNTDVEILGSLFGSTFIIQGVLSSAALLILIAVLKIPNANIMGGILAIFLSSMLCTAFVVAVTRWIKNATLASLTTVIVGILVFGLGLIGSQLEEFTNIPKVIERLSIISPLTWLLKVVEGGKIFIPILIVVLISGVLLTAGSFRLRDYVKE